MGTTAPGPGVTCGDVVSAGQPDFPVAQTVFEASTPALTLQFSTQCNRLSAAELAAFSVNVLCPSPLVAKGESAHTQPSNNDCP